MEAGVMISDATEVPRRSDLERATALFADFGLRFKRSAPVDVRNYDRRQDTVPPPTAVIALSLDCVEFLFDEGGRCVGMSQFAPCEVMMFEPARRNG
jgi:hypothetical protein